MENEVGYDIEMSEDVGHMELFMLPPQSVQITDLLDALVKASLEFEPVKQSGSASVPYRRVYATLDDLNAATEKPLARHGLRIIHQQLPLDRDVWVFCTKLWHSESGQWIAIYSPVDPEPPTTSEAFSSRQEWGKDSTYLRKFHAFDLLNLTPESDTDGAPTGQRTPPRQPASGKATASQGAAQGKRPQSPPEKKTWAILNGLGIDQAAWKADVCARYKVDSCTKLAATTWLKIASALEKYKEMIALICDHWQAKEDKVLSFLVYKFEHRIGEAYDVLHEALNSENGQMAELCQSFCEWKEMPEGEPEAETEPSIDMNPDDEEKRDAPETAEVPEQAEGSESKNLSEEKQLLAKIRKVLAKAGHDKAFIDGRMHGLQHQKVPALKMALETAKKQLENANGNGKDK